MNREQHVFTILIKRILSEPLVIRVRVADIKVIITYLFYEQQTFLNLIFLCDVIFSPFGRHLESGLSFGTSTSVPWPEGGSYHFDTRVLNQPVKPAFTIFPIFHNVCTVVHRWCLDYTSK